jgi:DegV family protein with EDD domain
LTVRIVTDSTADLPTDILQELDITVVPACVIFGNKTYRDGIDISQDEVYHKMIDENISASTSQPPPIDFATTYRKLLKNTDEIVSIQATSKLSGLYNSALQGREMTNENNRIAVVDSLSVSMGLGLLTILAARLAKMGENLPTIVDSVKQSIPQIRLWGFFDTLKYALQGGRLGKAKALLGSVLPIKAILTMREGELHPTGAVRTRIKGIERLVDNYRKSVDVQDAAVVYSTTPNDANTLRERINSISDKIPIHISRLGPALGVHGGPGTLILALREKIVNRSQEIMESEMPKKRIRLRTIHRPKLDFVRL